MMNWLGGATKRRLAIGLAQIAHAHRCRFVDAPIIDGFIGDASC
jgi:hypothetical protein